MYRCRKSGSSKADLFDDTPRRRLAKDALRRFEDGAKK
jgi:hypothetical protein